MLLFPTSLLDLPIFINIGDKKETIPISIVIEPESKNEFDIPIFSANAPVNNKPTTDGKTAKL